MRITGAEVKKITGAEVKKSLDIDGRERDIIPVCFKQKKYAEVKDEKEIKREKEKMDRKDGCQR